MAVYSRVANGEAGSGRLAAAPSANPLVFVNISSPHAVESDNIRRLVRSSATRHSHRDPARKPKSASRAKRSSTRQPTGSLPHSPTKSSGSSNSCGSPSSNEQCPEPWELPRKPDSLFRSDDLGYVARMSRHSNGQGQSHAGPRAQSREHADDFELYPVPSKACFPRIRRYYRDVHLPPGIKTLQLSESEGADYIDWHMREGMTEPALFYLQLLNGCTPLLLDGRAPRDLHIWLRGQVVRSINDAIGDPRRALTTATLSAVAGIALYEHLHGDKLLAVDVHSRAFARMTIMCGGVAAFTLPRIAWELLLWTDTVLSSSAAGLSTAALLAAWAPDKPRKTASEYLCLMDEEQL